jgi:biopolymer transport protein ExbD
MSISFKCPNCGKRLRADASRAGRAVNCPRCATTFTIPPDAPPSASPTAAAAAAKDEAEERPGSEHGLLLVKPIHAHHEDLVDMTAMVDIVFFLLIFFMVTSMQSLEAVIGLPTPQAQASSSASVAEVSADPNYVTVTIYEDDTVWIDEQPVFGAQDLRTRLRALRKNDPLLTGMLVVGSPDASHGTFVMVLDAGADAGLGELMFSVPNQLEAVSVGG